MDLTQMYQMVILDHARERHGYTFKSCIYHGDSFQVNPTCGDEVTVKVALNDPAAGELAVISEFSWEGQGCSISQASLSIMHDLVIGQTVQTANKLHSYFVELMENRGQEITDEEKADALGDANVFVGAAQLPARIKCALLGWMALKAALAKALIDSKSDYDAEKSATIGTETSNKNKTDLKADLSATQKLQKNIATAQVTTVNRHESCGNVENN